MSYTELVGEQKVKNKAKGGQPKNRNAVRHGAYVQVFDGRTRAGKLQRQVEAALVTAMGGDPSPQQVLILQRAAVKAIRCSLLEGHILSAKKTSITAERHYLAWARELRLDLQALGLQRQARPVPDLEQYVQEAYGKA